MSPPPPNVSVGGQLWRTYLPKICVFGLKMGFFARKTLFSPQKPLIPIKIQTFSKNPGKYSIFLA
jgi:hypothetical protein